MKRVLSSRDLKHWYSILALVALGLLVYGSSNSMLMPMLFGDAWGNLKNVIDGTFHCPQWDSLRPLSGCWFQFMYYLFGLNVIAYHVASLVATMLTAVLLYLLLDRLLPKHRIFNLIAAMLFLTYPTDYTFCWTIIGVNLRIPIIIFLSSCLLLIHFWRGNGWWAWVGALILLVFSLGVYEIHIGLTAGGAVALFVLSRRHSLPRRMAILAPALIAVLFAILRWSTQLAAGTAFGWSTESLGLSPSALIFRLISGYRISLLSGWLVELRRLFQRMEWQGEHTSAWAIVVLTAVVALMALMVTLILKLKPLKGDGFDKAHPTTLPTLRQQFMIGLGGLLALGAGYIPIIIAFCPTLAFGRTRANILPSVGAAAVLAAGLAMVVTLLGHKGRQATLLFILLATPFILLGGATQIAVRQESEIAWSDQKSIWQQMFEIAPDLAPGTNVFLLLPEYDHHLRVKPFLSGPWGFSSALSLLYGHDDLQGFFIYDRRKSLRFTEEGIIHPWPRYSPIVPYDQALLFQFNRDTGNLDLITELPPNMTGIARPISDLCTGCILTQPGQQTNLRWLVE
ncbi:MAG: hypothetical protein IMF11_21640 [Proteobacteria bacterium]|nr:hypothetical protein [Pseudomonadota bacterium]